METKPKNRAWVKDAAIVFLVVLLILTFFSNTIMNHSLPEVATQMVTDGTITAKVRGTGTVTALGDHKVKATANQTIGKVVVKAGQEVNAGDILFVLGAGDSAELEEAMNTLEDLQTQYAQAALSVPLADAHVDERQAMEKAKTAYDKAKQEYENVEAEYKDAYSKNSETVKTLVDKQSTLTDEISLATQRVEKEKAILTAIQEALTAAEKAYNEALINAAAPTPTPTPTPTTTTTPTPAAETTATPAPSNSPETTSTKMGTVGILQILTRPFASVGSAGTETSELDFLKNRVDELQSEYNTKNTEDVEPFNYDNAEVVPKLQRYDFITKLQYKIDTLKLELSAVEAELKTRGVDPDNVAAKKQAMIDAQYDYESKSAAYYNALTTQERSIASANVGLSAIGNQIARQQEKIKELSGEGDDNTITANVSGTVTEVNVTAGDTVLKDDILCAIEVPDMGYTVSFSVTNEQAQRLKVGDTASISNYYWGNSIEATLATIQTDKKNPMTNKTLTFNLEGDVTSGSELTISVGEKSARYDIIIPNSAIRTDSNGSFVLAVTEKSSPLGNRYIAKRVSIETLAQDDTNAAVTADLSYGDYVITTSSAPVASGDMVRMADSET